MNNKGRMYSKKLMNTKFKLLKKMIKKMHFYLHY